MKKLELTSSKKRELLSSDNNSKVVNNKKIIIKRNIFKKWLGNKYFLNIRFYL